MTILLPTSYLPPLSYISACADAHVVLIEGWETWPKQTLRNRCEIFGPNGRQLLTIPVNKPSGNRTRTKDIRIAGQHPWQRSHLRSLETAYNKSPYFLYYQDNLRPFYERKFTFLLDFNSELTETLFGLLRLDKKLMVTGSYLTDYHGFTDLRFSRGQNERCPECDIEYYQVFSDRHGFQRDLSVVDLLFNTGPDSILIDKKRLQ